MDKLKQYYNKIYPVKKRAIVAVNPEDKKRHKIEGTDKELVISKEFDWDGRISNPTMGILMTDYENLKAGDTVLFHHNATKQKNDLDFEHDISPYTLFSISDNFLEGYFIFFGIRDGNYICVGEFLLAQRLYEPVEKTSSGLVLTHAQKKIIDRLLILQVPEWVTDIKVGDVVVSYEMADYEINFNKDGKDTNIIRLKYSDILGIDDGMTANIKKNPTMYDKEILELAEYEIK